MRNRNVFLIALVLILLTAAGAFPVHRAPAAQYAQLRILAQWASPADESDFQRLLAAFIVDNNVQATVISAVDLEETLRQQIAAGTAPDIVLMTEPALLREYAGQLVDLGAALGDPAAGYPAALQEVLSVEGRVYGRFMRLAAKGLVWYNPVALNEIASAHGLSAPPATWEDLINLSWAIAESGVTPWALDLADPVLGTDVVEALLLQRGGPDLVEGLAAGSIPWTDDRVRAVWQDFGALLDTGALGDPASLSAQDAALAPFQPPASAFFAVAPSTAQRWITASQRNLRAGEQLDFFTFPSEDGAARALLGGDFVALFNDSPITVQLAQYLTSPDTTFAWAARGGSLSPYADAAPANGLMESAGALAQPDAPVFDLSGRLPAAVRAAFHAGVLQYAADRGALDGILSAIEAAAQGG